MPSMMIAEAWAPSSRGSPSAAPGICAAIVLDVLALVEALVLGDRLVASAQPHRLAELVDLRARVVEVVLARDVVAGELQHPRERVTVGRVPAARRGQRPGRVRGHVLDVHAQRLLRRPRAPAVARGQHLARRAHVPRVGEEDVQEARPRDLDVIDRGPEALGELLAQALGDLARRRAERRREQHRRVRGVVAETGLLRALQAGPRAGHGVAVAQVPGGRLDRGPQLVDRVHGYDVSSKPYAGHHKAKSVVL